MKANIVIIILFTACCASCESSTSKKSTTQYDSSDSKLSPVETVQTTRSPENTTINFLIWYRNNRPKLSSLQLVTNADEKKFDSTKYYSVNFAKTENYLNIINASGYVSPEYIDHWRKYFLDANEQFKANPQNDGPPVNFEYDFVMQSQDFEEDLANIQKSKFSTKSIKENVVSVTLTLPSGQKLKTILSKVGRTWLIDKIGNH